MLESILEIKIAQIEVIIGAEIEKEKIEDKLGIIEIKIAQIEVIIGAEIEKKITYLSEYLVKKKTKIY